MSQSSPRGLRLHIGIFGRRNSGKSSLLNALTGQPVAIVSPEAGTTTDPAEKPMELLPLGPVVFIDTAGIDDEGALGALRVEKTLAALERTDLALLVAAAESWGPEERELLERLRARGTPSVVVWNKTDLGGQPPPDPELGAIAQVRVSALTGQGMGDLREAIVRVVPESAFADVPLLGDLVGPGECAVLVVPVDKEAPRGRLILPQVQAIRDLLDHDSCCLVVQERGLRAALEGLRTRPRLVVTDSQAFAQVAADTPPEIPLTSFSILLARQKGDLPGQAADTLAIDTLRSGDRVLVSEACTHHPIGEDIGRVKIPRWLREYTGADLEVQVVAGHDLPADLASYRLMIQCGACMHNRRAVLSRLARCRAAGVPATNYGLAIAFTLGIFERALSPFPGALEAVRAARTRRAG